MTLFVVLVAPILAQPVLIISKIYRNGTERNVLFYGMFQQLVGSCWLVLSIFCGEIPKGCREISLVSLIRAA